MFFYVKEMLSEQVQFVLCDTEQQVAGDRVVLLTLTLS